VYKNAAYEPAIQAFEINNKKANLYNLFPGVRDNNLTRRLEQQTDKNLLKAYKKP